MRILIYGLHYHPDMIGIPKYSGEMSEWFAAQGHEVEVITGKPFYPDWEISDEYKKKGWFFTEMLNGVKVRRCPTYVPKNATASKKIIHEGLFVLASMFYFFRKMFSRPDIIITVCPPFPSGILSVIYSKIFRVPFIYHVQDLQIDIAKDLGMIKNNGLLNLLFKIEGFIMKNATRVSTISEGMYNKIMEKGIPENQMVLFPNWVDGKVIYPMTKEESLKKEFGYTSEQNIVLYSGNLGQKQGLEHLIEVAENLKDNDKIRFIIVGNGTGKKDLVELANKKNLENVKFFPLQPYEKLSALLATGDVHLVLQKKDVSDLVLPSKLTSILASGGCPIVTANPNSSLKEVVNQNNMGIVIEPENTLELQKAILQTIGSDMKTIQKNARKYSKENLDKDNILSNFENVLTLIINSKRS